MTRFLFICLGGAAGTGARYLLSGWLLRLAGPSFPWREDDLDASPRRRRHVGAGVGPVEAAPHHPGPPLPEGEEGAGKSKSIKIFLSSFFSLLSLGERRAGVVRGRHLSGRGPRSPRRRRTPRAARRCRAVRRSRRPLRRCPE